MTTKVYISGLSGSADMNSVKSMLIGAGVKISEEEEGGNKSDEFLDIVVKKTPNLEASYAFVDFNDPGIASEAVDKLKDFTFQGQIVKAEFSDRRKGSPSSYAISNKVLLSDVPNTLNIAQLSAEFSRFGAFQCQEEEEERRNSNNDKTENNNGGEVDGNPDLPVKNSRNVTVTFESREEAAKAASDLNNTEIEGVRLQAKLLEKRSPRRTISTHGNGGANAGGTNAAATTGGRPIDFPLRILVQSDMVGAIIGRGGQTIRQITQQTRARVDVHRKDNLGTTDKAITIYGQPDNCTNACNEILKVMKEEVGASGSCTQEKRENNNEMEINLRMLAHNNLIGRIIGKQGSTIKKIMEDTNTRVTVSSINEINNFNLERIITISGEIDDISKAESEISAKLRAAYENDMQIMAPQTMMFPGLHPAAVMSTVGMHSRRLANHGHFGGQLSHNHQQQQLQRQPQVQQQPPNAAFNNHFVPRQQHHNNHHQQQQQHMGFGYGFGYHHQQQLQDQNIQHRNVVPLNPSFPGFFGNGSTSSLASETVYVYVPNGSVGAIIGAKGNYIRNIIKFSGASVKIAQDGQHQPKQPETNQQEELQQDHSNNLDNSKDKGEEEERQKPANPNNPHPNNYQPPDHRRVTIVGAPESQWKAQYLIFEKLREEGFFSRHGGAISAQTQDMMMQTSLVEEVRLTVEILVPSSLVGRIIGKSGNNVRELQKVTAATVKLPEQNNPDNLGQETPVHISGNFYSVQSAQRRLRSMIASSQQQQQNAICSSSGSGGQRPPRLNGGGQNLEIANNLNTENAEG